MIYHITKWQPEKIGIEAFQAQTVIAQNLKIEMQNRHLHCPIEELKQT
jgi:hypothetical protein